MDQAVRPAKGAVYSFLYNHWWPDGYEPEEEIQKDRHVEVEGIIELAENFPSIVKGVKVAVTPPIRRKYGLEPVVRGREAARAAGLRLMLHIGDIGAPSLEATPSRVTAEAPHDLEVLLAMGDLNLPRSDIQPVCHHLFSGRIDDVEYLLIIVE